MRAALAFVLVALFAISFLSLIPTPAAALMSPRYYHEIGACDSVWTNIACWSLTSGGATGASVPGPGNDVVIDLNSAASAPRLTDGDPSQVVFTVHDIIITSLTQDYIMRITNPGQTTGAILSAHDI